MVINMRYWFRPKRFWRWFAAYYPVSWGGWVIVFLTAAVLVYFFLAVDRNSHSVSDTLINFVPRAILVGIIFDVITRLTGEYPFWWRKR
mgnify:CR=1 FL=1